MVIVGEDMPNVHMALPSGAAQVESSIAVWSGGRIVVRVGARDGGMRLETGFRDGVTLRAREAFPTRRRRFAAALIRVDF
jgi:hypothetical protein